MINNERLIERFMRYVKVDSETGNEKEFSELIVKELEDLGLEVKRDNAGEKIGSNTNNIYCLVKGEGDESRIYSSHMDTVKPGININPVIEDGYIKSSGDTILGGDDKAGISVVMEALTTIIENNTKHNTIEIIFTISEEGGLNGSKNLDYSMINSKKGYIFDSGGEVGTIINQAPSQKKLRIEIIGEPAHAGGSPEKGISAINVGAEAISKMNLLRIDEETTANIGTFKAEGATNIVNPKAFIEAEVRSLSEEKLKKQTDHMIEVLESTAKKYDAKVKIDVDHLYSAYKYFNDDSLIKEVEKAMKKLDIDAKKKSSGGGSDANIFYQNGIKTINLGIGGFHAHTLKENLKIEDFQKLAKITYLLMTQ
ncbi:MAG: M20/M25/M40 family metallo-hydrolase [Bacillota bacterium]|nr:M20/M25/M40 family metallo-hydrolase [Bacillota bacterium]